MRPVSIHYGADGKPDGVMVQTLDESFVVEKRDVDGSYNSFNHDTATVRLRSLGKTTFNAKQGMIMAIYLTEINKMLEQIGGEPLEDKPYVSNELYKPLGQTQVRGDKAWALHGYYGTMYSGDRYRGWYKVRAIVVVKTA